MNIISAVCIFSTCFGFARGAFGTSHVWKEYRQDSKKCCSTDPDRPSNSCEQTLLVANQYIQAVVTPDYPHGLPSYKQCTWTIRSRPGKRVRIDFRDFYLVGPNQDKVCDEQFVLILSSKQYKMGPYCGNTGLQSIVSPDNLLVVQLETKKAMSTENYRGFRMEFTETEETPSSELRPPNWKSDQDMFLVGGQLQQAIQKFSPNKGQQQTENTNSSPTRAPPPPRPRTRRPVSRWPGRVNLNNRPQNKRIQKNLYGPIQNGPRNPFRDRVKPTKPSKKEPLLSLEAIIGIAVGGVVVLALLVLILCKICQVSSRNNKKHIVTSKTNENTETETSKASQQNQEPQKPENINLNNIQSNQGNHSEQPSWQGQQYQSPPNSYTTLPGYHSNQNGGTTEVEKVYGTLQNASSQKIMLFDPNTGTYFDPSQLQAVQPPPVYMPQQYHSGGYPTMPHHSMQQYSMQPTAARSRTMQHPPKAAGNRKKASSSAHGWKQKKKSHSSHRRR